MSKPKSTYAEKYCGQWQLQSQIMVFSRIPVFDKNISLWIRSQNFHLLHSVLMSRTTWWSKVAQPMCGVIAFINLF